MGPTTHWEIALSYDLLAAVGNRAAAMLEEFKRAHERARHPRARDFYPRLRALYARGYSVHRIAVELGLSTRTVYKHLTRALWNR